MLTQLLFIILFALCAFHYFVRHTRKGKLIDKIPGPPTFPVIGNLLMCLRSHEDLWQDARKMNKDYYPINRLWNLNFALVNIQHPDDIEILLTSMQHIEKSVLYDTFHPWFGTGLLTSTGAKWRHRRKLLTPAFHFEVLQKYLEVITEVNEKTLNVLKFENNNIHNVQQLLTKHTFTIISEAAMGVRLEEDDSLKKYRDAVREMGGILIYRIKRPWYKSDTLFNMTSRGIQQKKALEVLHGTTTKIINERKEYHQRTMDRYLTKVDPNRTNEDGEVFAIRKRRLSMLDLLIDTYKNEKQIDDIGIREEVDTFIFEGHDTSAIALMFILLLLAEHKDVQARARDEVTEILNQSNGKIEMSDIVKFNYVERCIKECLRLYPSVPVISRNINEDLQLKNYLLPKGIIANVSIYDVHHDPNFWSEPEKFDPDRFLPERMQGQHRFSYIPFSAGPRNCIGQKFAMMELKSFIAHLLYDFYLEPIDLAHEVPLMPDLVLRPTRPVYIKIRRIHNRV